MLAPVSVRSIVIMRACLGSSFAVATGLTALLVDTVLAVRPERWAAAFDAMGFLVAARSRPTLGLRVFDGVGMCISWRHRGSLRQHQ